jgi:hypothetical protein
MHSLPIANVWIELRVDKQNISQLGFRVGLLEKHVFLQASVDILKDFGAQRLVVSERLPRGLIVATA